MNLSTDHIKRSIQAGWDEMAGNYQAETHISLNDVHYAPLCPGERELRILGDVSGKAVLEVACGAAQNSIALAKMGAHCVGLDISSRQLVVARKLVEQEGVDVGLLNADGETLHMFRDCAFDVVISCFGWEFIQDLETCFRECHRVLAKDGLLIVGTVHPMSAFEWDADGRFLMVNDYFRPPYEVWQELKGDSARQGLTFFRTVEEMFATLVSAGFHVEGIWEPYPYDIEEMTDEEKRAIPYGGPFWESQYERLSKVPFSIVYKARKSD